MQILELNNIAERERVAEEKEVAGVKHETLCSRVQAFNAAGKGEKIFIKTIMTRVWPATYIGPIVSVPRQLVQ